MHCFHWKSANAFDEKNLHRRAHRVCVDCIATRVCLECGVPEAQEEFTPGEWQEAAKHRTGRQRGRCKACMLRNKPQAALRRCVGECQQMKPEADFTPQEWQEAAKHRTGRQQGRCRACMARNKSEYKSTKEFMKSNEDRRCKTCSGTRHGCWTCITCKQSQPLCCILQVAGEDDTATQ